jgi:hypothetical protein
MNKATWIVLLLTAVLGAVALFGYQAKTVSIPQTVVVGTEYQSAGGCQDTSRNVRIGIPNHEYLDLKYSDPTHHIAGVSLRETNKNGNSGVRNVKFDPQPGVLSFDIFAGGGGTVQCVPLVGCSCTNASGGSYGIEITAHYNPNVKLSVQ